MTLEELNKAIQDLLARREALLSGQKDQQAVPPVQQTQQIVVIGGAGQLGSLFVRLFEQSGYPVTIIEQQDWDKAESTLVKADLVLVAVPIHVTEQVISQLTNLKPDCILADVTSIKLKPVTAMLASHSGPVLGLHPMFGPDVPDLSGQTIIVSEGRDVERCQWFIEQLRNWGGQLSYSSADDHDAAMALIQVMRHFSTVAYGKHLQDEGANLGQITELSSPIYRLELAMVGRLFAQDPDLYTDIIFSNPDNVQMMRRYIERFDQLLDLVAAGDKEAFKTVFRQVSDWFGSYGPQFLAESTTMLAYKKHEPGKD